tara:strand:- start:2955 stop:3425 length:471 start_codon:yes stop_codon:yes gene_type:complete
MGLNPLNVLESLFDIGQTTIERIWPDPIKRAEELRKLEEIKQKGDLAYLDSHVRLLTGQLEINVAEAKHDNLFIAGWRPFIGWIGGMAMLYQFIIYPILLWVWSILVIKDIIPNGINPPPLLDSGALFSIVAAMLGIGAQRSYDKKQGTNTIKIKK